MSNVKDKKKAIFRVTLKLIAKQGFHNTPMSQIAKLSGTSAGIIYHYFENKEDLIHSLHYEVKTGMAQELISKDDPQLHIVKRFKLLYMALLDYFINNPDLVEFMLQYENSPYEKKTMWKEDSNIVKLFNLINIAVKDKLIKPLPIEIISVFTATPLVALAKLHNKGIIELTDEMKVTAVESCWNAIKL